MPFPMAPSTSPPSLPLLLLSLLPLLLSPLLTSATPTPCPSSLLSFPSSCSVCPSASNLPSVINGTFPGAIPGALVSHTGYTTNCDTLLDYPLAITADLGVDQCCGLCTQDQDCEYFTWTMTGGAAVNKGNCFLYSIDQCGFSDAAGTQLHNFDSSSSSSYSFQACHPAPSLPPPSPPPPHPSPPLPSPPPSPPLRPPPPSLTPQFPPLPVGVTTSPPPLPVAPPPGVKGDPHFAGWDGVHFDFTGRPGKSYCLLSDDRVHINMYLQGYVSKINGTEETHTWIKGLGILSTGHKLALYAREGADAERNGGYMKRMEFDGVPFELKEGESKSTEDGVLEIKYIGHKIDGDDDIDIYEVAVDSVIKFTLKMRPEVKIMRLPDNAWVHFSLEVLEEQLSQAPHGILGQTLWNLHNPESAPEGYPVQYSGILWAWQVAGSDGERYIQGKPRDYMTSNVLAPDCRFSRLEGAGKGGIGVFSTGCARKALIC